MIRVLVMIAVTGFLVSVVTLSTAIAIGGPEIITRGAWNGWGPDAWGSGWSSNGHGWHFNYNDDDDRGAQGSREMAWTGGDTLDVDVPADITYTQAPGAAKLTVTGPQRALDNLVLEDGHLRFTHGRYRRSDLVIVMTAPAVTHFDLGGSGRLAIAGYKQDKLSINVSGDAEVSAKGETKAVELSIAGSGDTDLSDLKVSDANVDIEGSGQATLAPTGVANVNISGSGDVTLLSRPAKLESNVSGSGSIHQKDGSAASDAPTPPASSKARRARI
jgi:putative autotransporter adhesin-like protein